jgi:hypothetical protein
MFAILYSIDIYLFKKKPESEGGAAAHPATPVGMPMHTHYSQSVVKSHLVYAL